MGVSTMRYRKGGLSTWIGVAYAFAGAPAGGQPLPGPCHITFEGACPDAAPLCGAHFGGSGGCEFADLEFCYSGGFFSFKVAASLPLTIQFSGDLLKLDVFFAAQGTETGTMTFFDAANVEVDSPTTTNGDCLVSMPPTQLLTFSRAVRRIEVTATGTAWIDDFIVNPHVCGNGTLEAGEACDDGNLDPGDGCDANCQNEIMPTGVCCTGFPTPTCAPTDEAGCTGKFFEGEECDTLTCPECTSAADCDDGSACTTNVCAAGRCVFRAGVTCERGEACDVTTGRCEPAVPILLRPVAEGLCAPLGVTHAGDGSGRLFIVDQCGLIRVIDANGDLLATPFLDLTGTIPILDSFFDERGLLGLAFHPDYATNGRFFVRYSAPRPDPDPPQPCNDDPPFFLPGCHKEVLAEYAVSTSDPNVAASDPTTILFEIDEPQFNHNAGEVAFGPDGFLYFTLGDGGGANDGLDDPNLPHGSNGNGQNTHTALGTILRIDVDNGAPFSIPAGNPFADGVDGLPEIYAYGLRNPYKFSFDDGPGGDGALYVADVGQDMHEELNVVMVGGNYGWAIREGFHCFDAFSPSGPPQTCPDVGALEEALLDPVLAYDHTVGIAIVGGFIYRGSQIPALAGKYVFGDFSTRFGVPDGRLFFCDTTGPNAYVRAEFVLLPDGDPFGRFVKGFGEDEDGELYVCSSAVLAPAGNTGTVFRVAPPCPHDFNVDGVVGPADLAGLLDNWGPCPEPPTECPWDLNGDGDVGAADLANLLDHWGSCPLN